MLTKTINTTPKLAIVVPCYKEQEALPRSLPVLGAVLDSLIDSGEVAPDSYILCVDDGSPDDTWQVITRAAAAGSQVRGLTLAHNAGHQYALLAGLMHVRSDCDAAVSIDADLQDNPLAIKEMVRAYAAGAEIVYGVRHSRNTDTWFKRNSARAFYKLQKAMGLESIYDHADYRLMSARALRELSRFKEQHLFLRGIVPLIGLNTSIVYYDREERIAGESKYPLKKMLSFSIDGITSFTARPLRWIFLVGLLLLFIDLIVAGYVFSSLLWGNTVGGWSSLMLSIWFLGSLVLMAIGVTGEYIGKIFTEVKGRPRYIIKDSTHQLQESEPSEL